MDFHWLVIKVPMIFQFYQAKSAIMSMASTVPYNQNVNWHVRYTKLGNLQSAKIFKWLCCTYIGKFLKGMLS